MDEEKKELSAELSNETEDQKQEAAAETKERTFTQAEVNRMMAREKKQGRQSVINDLGVKDVNELDTYVEQFKQFLENQQNGNKQKDVQDNSVSERVAEAESRAMKAELKAEALTVGVKSDCVDDVIILALNRYTEGSDMKVIFGEIKTKYPNLFAESQEKQTDKKSEKKTVGKNGTGATINFSDDTKGEKSLSLGERLATQKKSQHVKGNFFGNKK